VAILDVNEAAAGETARETGGFAITADVTDAGSVEAAVTAAREWHGPARIAVNCAGIGRRAALSVVMARCRSTPFGG
jgi:NAD(P)-dependent dehydrogenase (short-subunit alcohol dehydrogenase family)